VDDLSRLDSGRGNRPDLVSLTLLVLASLVLVVELFRFLSKNGAGIGPGAVFPDDPALGGKVLPEQPILDPLAVPVAHHAIKRANLSTYM